MTSSLEIETKKMNAHHIITSEKVQRRRNERDKLSYISPSLSSEEEDPVVMSFFILVLLLVAGDKSSLLPVASAFSVAAVAESGAVSTTTTAQTTTTTDHRPHLKRFGQGIKARIVHSEEGTNRFGQVGAYSSKEVIPCLDMKGSSTPPNSDTDNNNKNEANKISSEQDIRTAFMESSRHHDVHKKNDDPNNNTPAPVPLHGRSSGSGCTIIRLKGTDAASIHGLMQYSNHFFQQVDNKDCNHDITKTGVFSIAPKVYAGFDDNYNGEGKMQFLDTRIMPNKSDEVKNIDPLLIPLEVGDLVGVQSLNDAHKGMRMLLDIGTQITSAVLDMDSESAEKLIDDGTLQVQQQQEAKSSKKDTETMTAWSNVSNSYHRLIRYLKPEKSKIAFDAHVDSSFVTLIPMPELPGLEVWSPSITYNAKTNGENMSSQSRGEWVRPITPALDDNNNSINRMEDGAYQNENSAYVVVLAGEFLQLASNGQVPVCIHRVIPPVISSSSSSSSCAPEDDHQLPNGSNQQRDDTNYTPRVSAPMFLRPRRGEEACLNVHQDLNSKRGRQPSSASSSFSTNTHEDEEALYFEKGLLEECDTMHLWSTLKHY